MTIDKNAYDAIVVGSGLAGLTAGALLARDGRRVLLLERHKIFGGAATAFRRPGMTVEVGLHEMDGLDPDDGKLRLFEKLGILDDLDWVKVPNFYAVRHKLLGDSAFVAPDTMEACFEATAQRFPQHRDALKRYFREIARLRSSATAFGRWQHSSPVLRLAAAPLLPIRLWPLIRHDRTTLGDFLDRLFGSDESVKLALVPNLSYYTDNPYRFSLIYFAAAQGSYITGGGHYLTGGSQVLSDRLVQIIRDAGGDALSRRHVNRILVEQGRAVGAVHTSIGQPGDEAEVRAPVVIGNASPQALKEMLPKEQQASFFKPYQHRKLSTSLWSVYLGLDRPPSELGLSHYSEFFLADWQERLADFSKMATLLKQPPGDQMPSWVIVNYDCVDSGLAGEGRYPAVMCGLDQLANWEDLDDAEYRRHKAAWLEALIGDLERKVPGISRHIVYKEMATARTLQRYLNTPGGTPYGFEQEPLSAGRHRPGATTKVPGLYLASVFASPGGGFTGALIAGEQAHSACRRDFR